MSDKNTPNNFAITDEMVARGLEFFERTSVSSYATETTYPEFVSDLLNFSLFGIAPWAAAGQEALDLSDAQ